MKLISKQAVIVSTAGLHGVDKILKSIHTESYKTW